MTKEPLNGRARRSGTLGQLMPYTPPPVDDQSGGLSPGGRGPGEVIRLGRRSRAGLRTAIASCAGAVGWSTGCAIGRLPVTFIAASVVAVSASAIAVIGAAVFGGGDPRSPFERLMLIACLMLRRLPGVYIPPAPGRTDDPRPTGEPRAAPAGQMVPRVQPGGVRDIAGYPSPGGGGGSAVSGGRCFRRPNHRVRRSPSGVVLPGATAGAAVESSSTTS